MHILMTNDDGVMAPGILQLAEGLPTDWRITVIAPDRERSSHSHMLTVGKPLQLKEIPSTAPNIKMYSFSGTPTDCAKFALEHFLLHDMPDLLVSGINDGYNIGSDVLYSGTVGAAMEGLFYGVPSVALSTKKFTLERGKEIVPFVVEMIQKVFLEGQFSGCLNVNFPLQGPCTWKHVQVVNQGFHKYDNVIEWSETEEGTFILAGTLSEETIEAETDTDYIRRGCITMSALDWRQLDQGGQILLQELVQDL